MDQDQDTRTLYLRVLTIASDFVQQADGVELSIATLRELNPSASKIARHIRMVANIINDIATDGFDDENMAMNAFQCCFLLERIAEAIAEGDELGLQKLVRSLEKHSNAPVPTYA